MTIRKFVAPTTREAMMQVRRELGDDAVIIANRRVGNRIEILAAEPDTVEALVERSEVRAETRTTREDVQPDRTANRGEARPKVETFQDFVRRQMLTEGDPLIARAAERVVARDVPGRGAPASLSRAQANTSGLAMYQDVADIEDDGEAFASGANERATPRRTDTASAPRRADNASAPRRSVDASAPRHADDAAAPRRSDDAAAPRRSDDAAAPRRAREREMTPHEEGVERRPSRAGTLPQTHRAPQIETPAEPAVFRRRPAHVAAAPRTDVAPAAQAVPRAPMAAPPVDILIEPAAPVEARRAAAIGPAPQMNARAVAESAAAPMLTGHAAVPSLPMRSQAAPIATAARLREASINAAQAARAAQAQAQVEANTAAVVHADVASTAKPAAPANTPAQAVVNETAAVLPVAVAMAQANPAPLQAAEAGVAASTPARTEATAVDYVAPVVQMAPIAPLALAIETPAHGVAVPAWDVQFTARVAPVNVRSMPIQRAVAATPARAVVAVPPTAETAQTAAEPVQPARANVAETVPAQAPSVVNAETARPAEARMESALLAELQSMRDLLREQIASLATKPAAAPAPAVAAPAVVAQNGPATRVTTRLLTAGFSADVARRIAAHAPASGDAASVDQWLQGVLTHNIRCIEPTEGIVERAGRPGAPGQVFALVGPTGVGKTTTVAKLAARFAVRHGTSALGLITLDAYRVAAPEQLRAYGRILGTPVHLAQDATTLRELLATMVHKRLVLIDTCGLSQRDERLGEMLDLLAAAGSPTRPIQRVLLMNSASHAETLDDAARAWRAADCAGAILTKLDEAARIGGSLDATLRHRLTLLGLTNGQRVPEDWHAANGRLLAHLALKPAAQLFDLADDEGAALIEAQVRTPATAGSIHG